MLQNEYKREKRKKDSKDERSSSPKVELIEDHKEAERKSGSFKIQLKQGSHRGEKHTSQQFSNETMQEDLKNFNQY